jgi:hypothetical protein
MDEEDEDLTAFLTDFQSRVKASRGKSPENDAVLDIAELWVERELQIQEARPKIRALIETVQKLTEVQKMRTSTLSTMLNYYCTGTTATVSITGYTEKSEDPNA